MRIITISREFGSGGRELGKRLADLLEFDYYDKEIITSIAQSKGLDENYVVKELDNHGWRNIPLSFRQSFSQAPSVELLLEQKKVLEEIAKLGKDCVIVGRNADVLLADYRPFNLFVCADMDAKVQRCLERADVTEQLSEKEMVRKIRAIDKNRSYTRELIGGSAWGEKSAYHMTVNTTEWDIKALSLVMKDVALAWFEGGSK